MRQLLPALHQLSQGQDADGSRHRGDRLAPAPGAGRPRRRRCRRDAALPAARSPADAQPSLLLVANHRPRTCHLRRPGSSLLPSQISVSKYTHARARLTALFPGTTQVSRYQKGGTNLDFTEAETVSGSGISWAICKSAPHSKQITTPASHHSVFYRPDALPAAQPTASKHFSAL